MDLADLFRHLRDLNFDDDSQIELRLDKSESLFLSSARRDQPNIICDDRKSEIHEKRDKIMQTRDRPH